MEFANLWILIIGGVGLVGLTWWTFLHRGQAALRVADAGPVRTAARRGLAHVWRLPDVLRVLALGVLVVGAGRPQTESRTALTGEGADVVIALDMSGSMNAIDRSAEEIYEIQSDGREPLNRFQAARQIIKEFTANRTEDRLGLVVFGEAVYLKFPLTLDYRVVLDQLDELVLDDGLHAPDAPCENGCTISGTGTALGDALARSYRRLRDSKAKTKAIVLITDGKREGGKLAPRTVARYIADRPAEEKVRVYTFLVGSPTGAKLPRYTRRPDRVRGGWRLVHARDEEGRKLYQTSQQQFPTDPALLKEIADVTGGRFFEAYDEDEFRAQFEELEKTEFETKSRSRKEDVFLPWLILGAALLGLEWLLRLTVMRRFP